MATTVTINVSANGPLKAGLYDVDGIIAARRLFVGDRPSREALAEFDRVLGGLIRNFAMITVEDDGRRVDI